MLCENPREYKHFYAYIIDPNGYDFDAVESPSYRTIGDSEIKDIEYQPYPEHMKSKTYKNGMEYTILTTNTNDIGTLAVHMGVSEMEMDEKVPT
jgi:hypothetical protein